jgi:circadian clock protein KaiC
VGGSPVAPLDVSYLADSVLLFRYFEMEGHVHKALAAVKKRAGKHETAIRELLLEAGAGVRVGPSLEHLQGVLAGTPYRTAGLAAPAAGERDVR